MAKIKFHSTDDSIFTRLAATQADLAATKHLRHSGATADHIPGQTPSLTDELRFITGVDAKGRITGDSYWGAAGTTAHKWGAATLGKGAVVTYTFDGASHFTAAEKAAFLQAFAMWSAIGDVTFKEVKSGAGLVLQRGHDGDFWSEVSVNPGAGKTVGTETHATISVDTSIHDFDITGGFNQAGGHALGTLMQQVGYVLGLGMGGVYAGDPAANQYSAYDNKMYTVMSNVSWADWDAEYVGENPIGSTIWGDNFDSSNGASYLRTDSVTPMLLDIWAIQDLYGVSHSSPFTGGQTYGFNCNIAGPLHDFYDFTVNYSPVVTIYNQGENNTLDLSGWWQHQSVTLKQGGFSSLGGAGVQNNVFIQFGTKIDTLIGSHGNDTVWCNDDGDKIWGMDAGDDIHGGAGADWLNGGKGWDTLEGGAGADLFVFDDGDASRNRGQADRITDFSHAEGDKIDLSAIDAVKGGADDGFRWIGAAQFDGQAGELRFNVAHGSVFLSGDVNGDGKADFYIELEGVHAIAQADLVM